MYDDNPPIPIPPPSWQPSNDVIRIETATAESIAHSLGIRIPDLVNAKSLDTMLRAISNVAIAFKDAPTAGMPLEKKLAWVLRIITVVTASLTMILATYNASKPSPATPADVAPEKIADAVWGP